jgi:hypothetical protein
MKVVGTARAKRTDEVCPDAQSAHIEKELMARGDEGSQAD